MECSAPQIAPRPPGNRHESTSLSVRGACKRYGVVNANAGVSLDVAAGGIVGLLGPNGAGKTTLIRLCAGWLTPDAGEITVMGCRQSLTNRGARAHLGVVSRDAPLHQELTVEETLFMRATLCGLHGPARAAACNAAVDDYCLGDFARRRIAVLSSGMQQRVAVACAMLHDPSVLLLDEPTTGLDPEIRRHIWQCLATLRARGVAILLTTHYFEEAAALCDVVHLLIQGRISLSLSPSALDGSARRLEEAYLRAVDGAPASGGGP